MNFARHDFLRLFLAGTFFWMVFLLTPRVWVDDVPNSQGNEVPVRALDEPDQCLWCDGPAAPSQDCEEDSDDQELWLNPDSPLPQTESPCRDQKDDDDGPNA